MCVGEDIEVLSGFQQACHFAKWAQKSQKWELTRLSQLEVSKMCPAVAELGLVNRRN